VSETQFMARALQLASQGEGWVNPNPLVGAVVVQGSKIVGQGYHARFGGPHAEVMALEEAGEAARGATLYVTLEPCCHHGKTPPCTDRILEAGVRRVVYAMDDPNPKVCGQGAATLRTAGIDVRSGLLREAAEQQNEIFRTYITQQRPFIHLKLAVSLDGRIATRTGDSKWITGEAARLRAHELRRRHAAILVGVHTARCDDPRLDVRHVPGPSPRPVVLDPAGETPLSSKLLGGGRRPVVVTDTMRPDKEETLTSRGVDVWRVETSTAGCFRLDLLLRRMHREGIDSVLVEGGGETAASFIEAGLVDRVTLFLAPRILGGTAAIPAIGGVGVSRVADAVRLCDLAVEWLGDDLLYTGRIERGAGGHSA
jgi:diaminohydroxyphosphoribosylaminopyrimidine deaminase / 5-amino-6-(5-phosphoribosylamino)uracil reductase